MDYEKAKHIARYGSFEARAQLAADGSVAPEILVFLAADTSDAVRTALAGNPRLPGAAVRILARDALVTVRELVAAHVGRLWPERAQAENEAQQILAREALAWLATDEAMAVRAALATAIADVAIAPPEIAETLALDAAQAVAEPILRHYSRFTDAFLIDIVTRRSESWAKMAVATRATISPDVVGAIIENGDSDAVVEVAGNSGAHFTPELFARLIEQAKTEARLAGPLVRRADLPPAQALHLAEFIDEAFYTVLAARGDFDAETRREIVGVARRRLDWLATGRVPAIVRVRELYEEGKLDEDAMRDALAFRDEAFVQLGLSILSRLLPDEVDRLLKSNNPKAMVALVWKAGLSARTALQLQKTMGNIEPLRLVHPKGGSDYALSEVEMLWQFEFYGIKV